jgi:hypothetical protein
MTTRRLVLLFAVFSTTAFAQWLNFPTPGTPRTRDGKPNLTAPAPRAIDGKPDLSGVWRHEITPRAELARLFGDAIDSAGQVEVPGMEAAANHKYSRNILVDFKAEESPLRPETAEIMRRRAATANPAEVCAVGQFGIPLAGLLAELIKIVQAPRMSILFYEIDNLHRQIYTDGRALPREFELPSYLGYSVGHWERDIFVVETTGFNGRTRLDLMGHPESEAMRITERFHRRDFGHLDSEMTFDDPKMYTRPFTIKVAYDLQPDTDIFEMFCTENERDRAHLQKR